MRKGAGNKYHLSDSFEKFLADISEGFLNSSEFDKLYSRFEQNSEKFFFTASSEANLIRIISSLYDKKSFLIDSLKYDHHLEVICAISSLSNYLTDIVVRQPEYLYMLFDQQFLTSIIDADSLQAEVKNSIQNFKTLQSRAKMLRNVKRKYLLKIGAADLLGFCNFENTVLQLSTLANVLSSILFEVCFNEIKNKYKVTLESDYALCSLGKLGGRELNYSSDIDLILFYKENYEIHKIRKEYHEIITEALQLFIREATAVTPENYLYRVDLRLRPDGRNSLLCRTISDYLTYYEVRGEDWERQMLIKLGFVGGSKELFDHFKYNLDSFIYPKTLRYSVTEVIRKMKRSIEASLKNKNDIKIVPGGIRDIEFAVQALQLINGGKIPKLKTGNTLSTLSELKKSNLINEEEYVCLRNAYVLYRKIEHFVQLMNDKQTHSIPTDPEISGKLARFLGFESPKKLENAIEIHRKNVRLIYENIVGSEIPEDSKSSESINFTEQKKAKSNLDYLRFGLSLLGEKQFDNTTVKRFREIENELFSYLNNCSSPDLVLDNFVRVIKNVKFPSIWYSAFSDKLFFKSFLRICQFSQRAVDSIVGSPNFGDLLLTKKVFNKFDTSDDSATLSETLFILAIQHACGIITFPYFSQILTKKVEQIICTTLDEFKIEDKFFCAGLGSFGNCELSFGSDIDLIIVVEKITDSLILEKSFQEILKQLRKNLRPFKVDIRLRPEGKSAQLLWDITGYEKYIDTRMRIWEFQALTKTKLIYGSDKLFEKLINMSVNKLNTFSKDFIKKEIIQMYQSKLKYSSSNRIKVGFKSSPGSLITLDTIISLMLVLDSKLYKGSVNLNSVEKFRAVVSKLNLDEVEKIRQNYILLKNMQIGVQNLFNQSKSTLPGVLDKENLFARYFGYHNFEDLRNILDKVFKEDITLLNNILET